MQHPAFFADAPALTMHDPLAHFLGAAADGLIDYHYVDAVRLAGHSCPTVASAWVLTCRALRALYGATVPERGGVRVEMRGDAAGGVTGVMANVAALVTGAAGDAGFKGIAGHFDRRNLLAFAAPLPCEMRFTRIDTGAAVDASADLTRVPADPAMMPLLHRCIRGEATPDEHERFRTLWQDRVRRVLEHADDEDAFVIRDVSLATSA